MPNSDISKNPRQISKTLHVPYWSRESQEQDQYDTSRAYTTALRTFKINWYGFTHIFINIHYWILYHQASTVFLLSVEQKLQLWMNWLLWVVYIWLVVSEGLHGSQYVGSLFFFLLYDQFYPDFIFPQFIPSFEFII